MRVRRIIALIIFLCGALFSIYYIDGLIIRTISSVTGIKLNEEFRIFGLQHFGIELIVLGLLFFLSSFIHERNRFLSLSLVVVIFLFFAFLLIYAVNIPITDDYKVILNFSNHYFFTDSVSEKYSLFTSIYSESRFVTIRLAIIILHFLTGAVNIKSLIIIANGCLPAILFFYYKSIAAEKYRMEITLMIALLIFHFGYYDAIVWATDAFVYQFTIAFLMLSLFLVNKKSASSQIIAGISALFAAMTFGNGVVVFPIIILFFVIERKWKTVFVWTFFSALFYLLYFQNYFPMSRVTSFPSFLDYFSYSCCFLGSAFQFMYNLYLPFMVGILIWILFVFITIKAYYRKNYFIYGLILFVILSSLIAAHFRLSMGLHESISNRYGFFSILVICSVIIALRETINERKQKSLIRLTFCLCLAYHLLSGIFFFPEVPVRKQKLEAFISDIKSNALFKPIPPVIPEGSDRIVNEAIQKKIYFP